MNFIKQKGSFNNRSMKNSFILYTEYAEVFEKLNLKERGMLITAIYDYAMGKQPQELTKTVDMAFVLISKQMDRDNEKYEEKVVRAKTNGSKGGRPKKTKSQPENQPKKTQENQKNQVGFFKNQTKPNKSLNDNVNVNVNDNVNVNVDVDGNVNENANVDADGNVGVSKNVFAQIGNYPPSCRPTEKESLEKNKYLTSVYLTDAQHQSLVATYGREDTEELIRILEAYKVSTGKKYNSDFAAINSWCVNKLSEQRDKKQNLYIDTDDSSMKGFNFEDFLEGPAFASK